MAHPRRAQADARGAEGRDIMVPRCTEVPAVYLHGCERKTTLLVRPRFTWWTTYLECVYKNVRNGAIFNSLQMEPEQRSSNKSV